MLEILFLIRFCKALANIARGKRRSTGWAALGPIFWVGGEVSGLFVGLSRPHADELGIYGFMIGGAIIGALISYVIVRSLSEIPPDNGLPQARVL